MNEPSKRCTGCDRILPLGAFNVDKRKSDGRRQPCKVCERVRAAVYRRANLERVRKGAREWAAARQAADVAAQPVLMGTCECGAVIFKARSRGRWFKRCADCQRKAGLASDAAYRQRNQDRLRREARERAAADRAANPEAARQAQRDHWRKIKNLVLDHYGRECACCGATTRLSVDHVNGDGADHRVKLYGNRRYGSGTRFYGWLIRNGFPGGYQVLCMRCNTSKRKGERCQLVH